MEGQHTDWMTLQEPGGRCGLYEATHRRTHMAQAPRRPPADAETAQHPEDRLTPKETLTMGVRPAAMEQAISRHAPRQANLAREGRL